MDRQSLLGCWVAVGASFLMQSPTLVSYGSNETCGYVERSGGSYRLVVGLFIRSALRREHLETAYDRLGYRL